MYSKPSFLNQTNLLLSSELTQILTSWRPSLLSKNKGLHAVPLVSQGQNQPGRSSFIRQANKLPCETVEEHQRRCCGVYEAQIVSFLRKSWAHSNKKEEAMMAQLWLQELCRVMPAIWLSLRAPCWLKGQRERPHSGRCLKNQFLLATLVERWPATTWFHGGYAKSWSNLLYNHRTARSTVFWRSLEARPEFEA